MKNQKSGIYRFYNSLTQKSYIGQSIQIEERYNDHKRNHLNKNYVNYNTKFYNALRKYGFENFEFSIIEECKQDALNEREIYWINYYDSYNNGYNSTPGGDFNPSYVKEIVEKRTQKLLNDPEINKKLASKGNAKVDLETVQQIRKYYQEGKTFAEIYPLYKEILSYSGFQQIWRGKTWPEVMPEVFVIRPMENTGGSSLNSAIIKDLRIDYMNSYSKKELSEKYNVTISNLNRILRLDRWNKPEAIPNGYIDFLTK